MYVSIHVDSPTCRLLNPVMVPFRWRGASHDVHDSWLGSCRTVFIKRRFSAVQNQGRILDGLGSRWETWVGLLLVSELCTRGQAKITSTVTVTVLVLVTVTVTVTGERHSVSAYDIYTCLHILIYTYVTCICLADLEWISAFPEERERFCIRIHAYISLCHTHM